jgi:hypothetical protein
VGRQRVRDDVEGPCGRPPYPIIKKLLQEITEETEGPCGRPLLAEGHHLRRPPTLRAIHLRRGYGGQARYGGQGVTLHPLMGNKFTSPQPSPQSGEGENF